jgi:mono/diheme cytochrome c family protein
LHSLGIFAALDMRTNELVWQQQWSEPCYSGAITTAGGLVFVGRNDGRLTALDSSDGTNLWEFQTGAGMNSTVSVFEQGGKQYVVAYAAGNLFAGSAKGDNVWLFALDGTLEQVAPGGRSPNLGPGAGPAAAQANVANGETVYAATCVFCHGEEALGGHGGGPTLANMTNMDAVAQVVAEGRNAMPALGGALSADQIRDVSAYVLQLIGR